MELIKKKICIRDFQSRVNPYSNACLSGVTNGLFDNTCTTNFSGTTWHYGSLTGLTNNGTITYYIDNMVTGVTLCSIPILITRNIDDIGIMTDVIEYWEVNKTYYYGETVLVYDDIIKQYVSYRCKVNSSKLFVFNDTDWEIKHGVLETGTTINFVGENKIDEFRRYSKTDEDKDLYNPTWNTGFTYEQQNQNGTYNKITSEFTNYGDTVQNLYSYIIGYEHGNESNTGIHFTGITNEKANISYKTYGQTIENSLLVPSIKQDFLLGIIEPTKVSADVNIDRGTNTSFDRHLKMGDIRGLDDLINYGNGFFKIKE
jgi:hypothetical protein